MLVQQFKPRPSGPLRYGVEQLGPAGAVLPRDPQLNHTRVEPRINSFSPQAIIARKQPRKAGAPRRQALGPSLSPSTLATAQAQSEQPYNVLLAPLQLRNPIFRNPSRPRARPAGPAAPRSPARAGDDGNAARCAAQPALLLQPEQAQPPRAICGRRPAATSRNGRTYGRHAPLPLQAVPSRGQHAAGDAGAARTR